MATTNVTAVAIEPFFFNAINFLATQIAWRATLNRIKIGCNSARTAISFGVAASHRRVRAFQTSIAMPFHHVDISHALRRVADRRIEEAMKQGKFDNLPGKGKPLDLEPMPAEENARLMWWALRLLKQNDVIPDEVRLRKTIDGLREKLAAATTAVEVTRFVRDINVAVRKLNTMGTTAMPIACAPVLLEVELDRFRRRTS